MATIVSCLNKSPTNFVIAHYSERSHSVNYQYIAARRDKFLMNQVVAEHGLRVVQQRMCSSLETAMSFAREELKIQSTEHADTLEVSSIHSYIKKDDENMKNNGLLGRGNNLPPAKENNQTTKYCVVKPCRGVASDDVYFCKNLEDVKDAFERIHHTPVFGSSVGATHESVVSVCDVL